MKWINKLLGKKDPVFTQEYMPPDTEKQTQEVKCFKDGKYTHSVIVHYFTKEQIDRILNTKI